MFTRYVNRTYIPLTILSYSLEYKFFKYRPFIYHLDNLLLHLGVVTLIFLLARRWKLSVWAAGLGALLFGIHPMHVESVAWVTERKDVLYSFFYLLALYHYQNYIEMSRAREMAGGISGWMFQNRKEPLVTKQMVSYGMTLLFGFLSILSKSMALSLPFILFLLDWLNRRRFSPKLFLEKIPLAFFCISIAAITYIQHARIPGRDLPESILIWIWTLTFYLKKFLLPLVVFPGYVLPKPVVMLHGPYFLAEVLLIAFCWLLMRYKSERWLVFAAMYYLASIFFLLRYDDRWDSNIVADRFMYLPSLGLCLWIGSLIQGAWEKLKNKNTLFKTIGITCLFFVILSLGMKTFAQAKLWGEEFQLWTKAIQVCPESFIALNVRGSLYNDQKKYDLAIKDFSQAILLRPDYVHAYINRGQAYYNLKMTDLALADYNVSAVMRPDFVLTYINRGLLYDGIGKKELALKDYDIAIQLNPENPYAFFNRGKLFFEQQKVDLALADFNNAIELKHDFAKAYVSRGNIYLVRGDLILALKDLDAALQIDPQYAGAYYNRSIVFYMNREFPEAWENALKAKSLGFAVDNRYLENMQYFLKKTVSENPKIQK